MIPADLSPAQLLETFLPAEWARARTGAAPPADATFEVVLDGDGGGTWTISVKGGALSTKAGAADATPDLRVRMTVADFKAALQGEAGAPDIFPKDLDLGRAIARIPAGPAGAPLGQGAVTVGIADFNGRTWQIALESGGKTTPSAQVTVDAATILAIKHGQIDPASAFFGGKIQLGGDVTWIMQAGMGFMQKRGSSGPLN